MKTKFAIILTCFGILFSSNAFSIGCSSQRCQQTYCVEPESPCACADNGWKYNDCISKRKYCEAFGNIGAL